jgi:hypothetical protein
MHKTTREQTQIDHQDRSRIAYTVNLYRVWIHKAGVNSPSYEYNDRHERRSDFSLQKTIMRKFPNSTERSTDSHYHLARSIGATTA